MILFLLAAQLLAATPAPMTDPRPTVRVVFHVRPDHPYTLQFKDVGAFEKSVTDKLVVALQKVRFLRFSTDKGEHTLFFLLDDRDEGVRDEELREIWLFAALNEEVTRENAKMIWVVREAGADNASIGSTERFAGDVVNALRNTDAAALVEKCLGTIDVATRARKPANSALWLMPFRIDQLRVGDQTVFRVWTPIGNYAAEPLYLREPLVEATDEYAGKTVTITKDGLDVIQSLEKRARIDANRVRIQSYADFVPQSPGQRPAGVKITSPKKK
jgi:hypothetical protein